jgi:hypothetical protein
VRWFYDTEFSETPHGTLDLISIGIVSEDGQQTYYAVCSQHDPALAPAFVRRHVLPHLPSPGDRAWRSRGQIRADLEELLLAGNDSPELWAWMGAYDHVVLCQLWGDMTMLPRRLPRFTRELRQLWESLGSPALPEQTGTRHDALADAQHNLVRWNVLRTAAAPPAATGR